MGKYEIRKTPVFHDFYSRLKAIALTVFEWENLPETCNARFLENTLFEDGQAIFVDDKDRKYINVRCTPASELNIYNEATSYTAFSTGYSEIFKMDECVFIRNNYLAKSTASTIILYAERLAEIELTLQVNLKAQKTPILIRTEEKTKRSLEVVYNQYDENKPKIIASKGLSEKPFEVLRTDAPFLVDRLREEKRAVWNEALEFLGINTNPSDKKKERLIVSEVESNNEEIDIQGDTMLLARQEACGQINKLFNLNVSVRKRLKEEVVEVPEEELEESEV